MTEEYRTRELENARREWQAARRRYAEAKTRTEKRDADEDIQFWGNKLAFLDHVQAAA